MTIVDEAKRKIMEVLENDLEKIEGISDSQLKLDFSEILYERNIPIVRLTDEDFRTEISTVNRL